MQQKMFMMMPVVFTVMFLWAPSGLNIYWLVNNVLAIAPAVLHEPDDRADRASRAPAAERRADEEGAARTGRMSSDHSRPASSSS